MTPKCHISPASVGRRRFVLGLAAGSAAIAGCGDTQEDNEESHGKTKATSTDTQNQRQSDELKEIHSDLQRIYDTLENHPIAVGERIIFEPTPFEKEFEYEQLRELANDTRERAEGGVEGVPERTTKALAAAAQLGEYLVNQRVAFHQVVAVGLTYWKAFEQDEYGRASEVIRDGHTYRDGIETMGELIEENLSATSVDEVDIDGYDLKLIQRTQDLLIEVVRWIGPAYRGLEFFARGIDSYLDAIGAHSEEHFENATESYETSIDQFEAAEKAFDAAQGTGKQLPHIDHIVDDIRCSIPGFLTSCRRLRESMEELKKGNEERAEEIGREGQSLTDKKLQRCY